MLLEADWVLPVEGSPLRSGAVVVRAGRIVDVGPAAELRARWGVADQEGLVRSGCGGGQGGEDNRGPDDERGHSTGGRTDGDRGATGVGHLVFPDCVLMPGLVNTHTHLEYSAFRGFSPSCGFGEWMLHLLLARRKLTVEDYAVSARWGARACVQAGMTCIADTSYEGWTSARAAREAGLRARIYLEVFGLDDARLPRVMERMEERLAALRAACGAGAGPAKAGPGRGAADLRGAAVTGPAAGGSAAPLVGPGLSPHAPYTVSERLYREIARFARREGLRTASHVAESRAEVELLKHGTGAIARAYKAAHLWRGQRWRAPGISPIALLDRAGALGPEMLAVHCVQLDTDDIAILAAAGTAVAHCPLSNQRLQCGGAPIARLRRAGVRVGLGTDSPASNDSLDLFAEMRAALGRPPLSEEAPAAGCAGAVPGVAATAVSTAVEAAPRAPVLDEEAVLRMATIEGAAALGMDHLIGSLEVGKDADIIAVRMDSDGTLSGGAAQGAGAEPGLVRALVAGAVASCVQMTMVRGHIVFRASGTEAADRWGGRDDLTERFAVVRRRLHGRTEDV